MTQGVIKRGMVAFVIFGAVYAHANDDVDITLNSALNLNSQIRDGQLIGYGRISTQQAHSGYQVLMNPLMILVKIIKLRWIHILSYDQMVVAATLLAQNLFTHGYALGKL
ncbi:hypothetical protein [Salmonella enterica]|uniref:hypothetical protein n=1 Tax=Salmonella enterica TaxID=28901 RepID=UPI001F547053|nr:hypothetical protein [Salmonella enterica]